MRCGLKGRNFKNAKIRASKIMSVERRRKDKPIMKLIWRYFKQAFTDKATIINSNFIK